MIAAFPSRDLKARFKSGVHLRFMEAHNGLSALIANGAKDAQSNDEFDGLWVSSLTCTASMGLPDLEMSLVDRRIDLIHQIAAVSTKPIIVDADTGGDVSTFRFFCRSLRLMGVCGVIVEEKANPKRNSLDESKQELADPDEFADKLMAGKDFVSDPDFLVIARLESLVCGHGVQEALRRARIYIEAGVDGLMIHSKSKSPSEVFDFCRVITAEYPDTPIFCVPTTYNSTPARELFASGVRGVIYANHQLRAAHQAMEAACLEILRADCSAGLDNQIASTRRIFDDVGYTREVQAMEARSQALTDRARLMGRA